MVAWPCEVSWELADSLVSVRGTFATRGAKGEEEYPYHLLGGIGKVSSVDEKDLHRVRKTSTQSGQSSNDTISLFLHGRL